MWPLDLPARDVLRLPGQTMNAWAVFDAAWYRETYDDAPDATAAAVLAWHLEIGQRLGHSPNRLFDEAWHRARYPAIAERIASGDVASAFDAYCRRGCLDRSAHWLFDELTYRDRYSDLTDDVLRAAELANGYDHYLRHGLEEGRNGHPLFQPAVYLAHFDSPDAQAMRRGGVFQHYLARIEAREPELRTSIYFDPDWYVRRYLEVAEGIATGGWKCALHHYLCNDRPTEFDPNESFSEAFYLERDPGLLNVIRSGHFRNGYAHFLRFGAQELRPPSPDIDLSWYGAQPSVRADIDNKAVAEDAFAHWLTVGRINGQPALRPEEAPLTDAQARTVFAQTAAALLPLAGRSGFTFTAEQPLISVVMTLQDGFALTMAAIATLRMSTSADIELILVDCGSSDETRTIERYVIGARVERFETDTGWTRAAEIGRQLARAPVILFLASDARLAPGALMQAYVRLVADQTIGAVGGMIVQPGGMIAQAGGILWNDGGTHDYQRGRAATVPEANFVRQIDFVSDSFLMVRCDLLATLDGFDHDCGVGYGVVDLCLRMAASGLKVVYDPSVVVFHDDSATQPGQPTEHFLTRHAAVLAERRQRGGWVQSFARHAGVLPRRILFIEDTIPLRRTGSGFVRSNDLVWAMANLGFAVTVFPVNGCDHDVAHVFGDMPETAEAMHTHSLSRLKEFLEGRPLYYDTVWVARSHNLDRVRPVLSQLQAAGTLHARIVLDTEAVTPHREALQGLLNGQQYDLNIGMRTFLANADLCQAVIAVTDAEAEILRKHDLPNVATIGHMIDPQPTKRDFSQRSGLLFVGAIHKEDSPNYDSLMWFSEQVLPLIEAQLGWETRLTIAGYVAQDVDMSQFEQHARIRVLGPVANLTSLYDAARVFVAPTRYAAGAPYKVLEAAAHGVPIVATSLLVSELCWSLGDDVLGAKAGDAGAFAEAVVSLYRNENLWRSVRSRALQRLARDHHPDGFIASVHAVLGDA